MKKMINFGGGRPSTDHDLQAIQNSINYLEALYKAAGPFVISGCELTANGSSFDMNAGVVYLNGQIIEVEAQQAISVTNVLAQDTDELLYLRPYDIGLNHVQLNQRARFVPSGVSAPFLGERLLLKPDGFRTVQDALKQATKVIGEVSLIVDPAELQYFNANGIGTGKWRGFRHPVQGVFLDNARSGELTFADPLNAVLPGISGPSSSEFYNAAGTPVNVRNVSTVLAAYWVGTAPGSPSAYYNIV